MIPADFKYFKATKSTTRNPKGPYLQLVLGRYPPCTHTRFQIFVMFTPKFGEMIQFDDHIFQMGWFNHQLA